MDWMAEHGYWIVVSPEDCIEGINQLARESGGFGGFLIQTVDWAPRETMLKSYELIARYVMPQFQGSVRSIEASNQWAKERMKPLLAGRIKGLETAKSDYDESRKE